VWGGVFRSRRLAFAFYLKFAISNLKLSMAMNKIIDIHTRIGTDGREESRALATVLADMDALGIRQSWICPLDHHVAVHNHVGNDAIASLVAAHADRFIGCAVANPWFGADAVAELNRAFAAGLQVLFLYPPLQGFQLSDPIVDPLVEVAVAHHAPIYAHTGTPICAEPFQLAALARRFSAGKFIMGHMGYSDFWYDAITAAEGAPNIWLDTSRIDGDIITNGLNQLGAERFLFGSDAPFCDAAAELEKIASLNLSEEQRNLILYRNAENLMSSSGVR
jgi:uncharacterized protein